MIEAHLYVILKIGGQAKPNHSHPLIHDGQNGNYSKWLIPLVLTRNLLISRDC